MQVCLYGGQLALYRTKAYQRIEVRRRYLYQSDPVSYTHLYMKSLSFRKDLVGVQDELLRFAYKLTTDREEANDLLHLCQIFHRKQLSGRISKW